MDCRQLPPWEEITYFNDPVVTSLVVPSLARIVDSNPQRVVLVLAGTAAGSIWICPGKPPGTNTGLQITTGVPNLVWTEKDHATLCTCAWYNGSSVSVTFTVIEVILRQWPDESC